MDGCEKYCSSSINWGFAVCLETVVKLIFRVVCLGISVEDLDDDHLVKQQ